MKVFDFTNGVKGKLLSEVHRPSYATGCLRDDKFYSNKNKSITFMFGAGSTFKGVDTPLNPKDFGVEAICYCTGQWNSGEGGAQVWEWDSIGTEEWLQEALKTGLVICSERNPKTGLKNTPTGE